MSYKALGGGRILENHILSLLSRNNFLYSVLKRKISSLRGALNLSSDTWRFELGSITYILPLDVTSDVTAKLIRRIIKPSEGVEISAEFLSLPVMVFSLDSILTLIRWGSYKSVLMKRERRVLEAKEPKVSLLEMLWAKSFLDIGFKRVLGSPLDVYLVNTIRFPKFTSPKGLEPFSDTTFIIPGDESVRIYSIYKSVCKLAGEVRESKFKEGFGSVPVELVDRDFRIQKLLFDVPYEDLEVIEGRGGVFNAIVMREDEVERGGSRYTYTIHPLDTMRITGPRVGEYELPLELLEVLRDEYLRSDCLTCFKWNPSRLREALRSTRPYLDERAFDSLRAQMLDDESLKLVVNSTGIYRVSDDTVFYLHPIVIELILRLERSLNVIVYSKGILDLSFEILRLLEEFKDKLSRNPSNISVVVECLKLSNMLGAPHVKQKCSTLLSLLKITVDAMRRSKSYNRVVEY